MNSATKPNVRDSLASLHEMLRTGQSARAEPIARQLQLAYPHRGDVNHMMALILSNLGRPEQAEPYHARAVSTDGRNTSYLLNYGLCLLRMGRVSEAAKHYERAAALEPSNPIVTWRIGSFHFELGQGEKALEFYERALATAPHGARPAIHVELVDCLLSLGRSEEAEVEIRKQLDVTPFRSRYVELLSNVGKPGVDAPVFAMVEEILQRPKLHPQERSRLLLRKAIMLDNSKRYDEAFETTLTAKKLLSPRPPRADFGGASDGRIDYYNRERIARFAEAYGDPTKRHIFVVGLPRSGTTLTAQIISAHSKAGSVGELETITYIVKTLRGDGPVAQIESGMTMRGAAGVRHFTDLYTDSARYLVPDRERLVDKMPDNFRFCAEIAFLFPNAQIVHCRRHPADTFISAFQNEMNEIHSYSYSPETYAAHYSSYARLMRHWKSVLPGRIMDLDYERLTAEPRQVVGDLLAFLGLDWEENCLHPERNTSTVRTFSRIQVRSAINASSVGRWKNYERHLKPILDVYQVLQA
jgi:tetratricopeptide (TPR) repeat protein